MPPPKITFSICMAGNSLQRLVKGAVKPMHSLPWATSMVSVKSSPGPGVKAVWEGSGSGARSSASSRGRTAEITCSSAALPT